MEVRNTSATEIELVCPICGAPLGPISSHISCPNCRHEFPSANGIPLLFWQNDWLSDKPDVTSTMQAFYEKAPFPNYDELDCRSALQEKARRGVFAKLLDEQIPFGSSVLEVGCGTGQLSNFLGMTWGRKVFGADACLNSLRMGEEFRRANEIQHVTFLQMNLFRPVFRPESFDIVICNGVLHHTSDPFLGFQSIAKLVKPGGYILIGLYNKYSRLTTDFRRLVFRASGDRFNFWIAACATGAPTALENGHGSSISTRIRTSRNTRSEKFRAGLKCPGWSS